MAYELVVEQLKEKCDCTEVNEKDVEEMINVVSMATCWMQEPCETFLMSERQEIIDLPDCLDGCEVYEFTPFYHPYEVDSFTFSVVTIDGIDETITPVTSWSYSDIKKVFRLKLPLDKCCCKKPDCGCPPSYALLVTYDAGYETIPDCLIPVFCMLLALIKDKNQCDCSGCQNCDKLVHGNDVEQFVYANGDVISPELDMWLAEFLQEQYKRNLSLISLCEYVQPMWGYVI